MSIVEATTAKVPARKLCLASLATGIALAGIALAAMCIDLINNYEFGIQVSQELAGAMALAALGVTALPAAAALHGWDWLLRLGTAASVILTIWAAISAYADRQGREILERQAANTAYEAAQADAAIIRQDITLARAELARINETATAEALKLMLDEAQAAANREAARGGCGTPCEKRKAEAVVLAERLGQARAKEAALARIQAARKKLEQAKREATAGPAEASMLATVVATLTGHDARDIARVIALATTGFAIIVTLLMAGLMHQAMRLIMQGFGMERLGKRRMMAELNIQIEEQAGTGESPTPASPADPAPLTQEQFIELFIARHVHADDDGEGIRSTALYLEFQSWWGKQEPDLPLPSQRAFAFAMASKGFISVKRGGLMRYENVTFEPLGMN